LFVISKLALWWGLPVPHPRPATARDAAEAAQPKKNALSPFTVLVVLTA
jgi:hypothetical protein